MTPAAPRSERVFGRPHQAHDCVPGMPVEAVLADRPAIVADLHAAILAQLETLGPVHQDAVVADPPIRRVTRTSSVRVVHELVLSGPADLDDPVRAWLTEAYLYAVDDHTAGSAARCGRLPDDACQGWPNASGNGDGE